MQNRLTNNISITKTEDRRPMDLLDLTAQGKIGGIFFTRNKISYEGAIYHIIQHAPGREPLFVEKGDYLYMMHCMKTNVSRYNYELFSFVLMSNHLHLLIRLNKDNLSEAMKELFRIYAVYFNKKYERKGPVFCTPFRASLCLDETYLIAASVYIHLNPVKAGIVKTPSEYKWSSYSLYEKEGTPNTFVNYKYILHILSDNLKKARQSYCGCVEGMMQHIKEGGSEESPNILKKFRTKFVEKYWAKENKKNSGEDILNEEELNKQIEELIRKKRLTTPQEFAARKYLIEQLQARGYTKEEIAKKLNISVRSVYIYSKDLSCTNQPC